MSNTPGSDNDEVGLVVPLHDVQLNFTRTRRSLPYGHGYRFSDRKVEIKGSIEFSEVDWNALNQLLPLGARARVVFEAVPVEGITMPITGNEGLQNEDVSLDELVQKAEVAATDDLVAACEKKEELPPLLSPFDDERYD